MTYFGLPFWILIRNLELILQKKIRMQAREIWLCYSVSIWMLPLIRPAPFIQCNVGKGMAAFEAFNHLNMFCPILNPGRKWDCVRPLQYLHHQVVALWRKWRRWMVTDPIMITMAMLMDLSCYCIGGQGVEVEVRRVGERIDPLCGQISLQWIRSVCSNGNRS